MKRLFSIAIILFAASAGLKIYGQDITYLSNTYTPVESHCYTRAQNFLYQTMYMGGVPYKNGFELRTSYGPTELGYAEFSLKGRYKTISFILGCSHPESSGLDKGIIAVYADGRKILDKVVASYEVPQRYSLDITGTDRLRFELLHDGPRIGIAEPALWKASQTPRETGRLTLAEDRPLMLVRDLRPYKQKSQHDCVSQSREHNDRREIGISGMTYRNGLEMNADIALIGNNEAWTFFNLGGRYSTLKFIAGPKDSDSGTLGKGWLTVKADDMIIHEMEIGEGNLAREVTLDITGCRSLGFFTEQASGSLIIGAADIMVYPAGHEPSGGGPEEEFADVPEELKRLPDVCRLISSIQPYAVGGGISRENMVYDGKSDHITFSMGGIRYNEGLVLQSNTHVLNDNTRAHALFNVGGQFDYISFTTGWISKCGVLKNDTLRVYADTKVVFEQPLTATSPNRHYVVPIYKCKRLSFEKRGIVSLNHPAFGVADIVAYRGEPVENDLFVHPEPDFPDEIDLIDLGRPYIHYVSPLKDRQAELLKDGSTKKDYFQMPDGQRIYKGFLLQTSVHFDLEMGPTGTPDVGVTGGMMGSAIMVGAVGGAAITAINPFGALIALASGGTAHESSCAAFNTWGQYDHVTFTVACFRPHTTDPVSLKDTPVDKLLIGADGKVVAELEVHDTMEPTTFTVPIDKAGQLMFWLQCGNWWSGQYVFYDLKLSKGDKAQMSVPNVSEMDSKASVSAPVEPYALPVVSEERQKIEWSSPKRCGKDPIDDYFTECSKARNSIEEFFKSAAQDYRTVAAYVSSTDGTVYRAVSIVTPTGQKYSISGLMERNREIMDIIDKSMLMFTNLGLGNVNANVALPSLGIRGAIEYGKHIKEAAKMVSAYKKQLEIFKKDKEAETALLQRLVAEGLTIDGIPSDDSKVFIQ